MRRGHIILCSSYGGGRRGPGSSAYEQFSRAHRARQESGMRPGREGPLCGGGTLRAVFHCLFPKRSASGGTREAAACRSRQPVGGPFQPRWQSPGARDVRLVAVHHLQRQLAKNHAQGAGGLALVARSPATSGCAAERLGPLHQLQPPLPCDELRSGFRVAVDLSRACDAFGDRGRRRSSREGGTAMRSRSESADAGVWRAREGKGPGRPACAGQSAR
jgi:hypothetical protein